MVIVLKNRTAIYQREAAEMLHNISLYPGLTEDQLCRFFPEKEATAKTLLSHMLKEGRIFCAGNDRYYANREVQSNTVKDLSRCVWVLLDFIDQVEWFPYNLYCMAGCAAAVAAIFLYRKLFGQDTLTDSERNFDFSAKGTYGTSGWMQPREVPAVLDMVSDLSKHTDTVLGMLDGRFLCIPEKTRMNGNLAVYGASGSMKTRSFCMNRILQSAARGESLIICDPKSELYEKSSEYMRDLGYTVRVFNLVSPENSDSWNCLKEIEGQELMAQLFVDVIIKNTNGTGKSDRFWDSGEMNLLKALVLYVDLTYPPEQRNIGEVYNLITQCSESQLNSLFDVLPLTHPAKAPYSLYQRASDSVRSGVISGLGSRLQVFQSELIKKITAYDEISLELPGQQPCTYYLVTSDQDSTFDFLASLFLSFAFIKLVRYADANCPGGRLPVPVNVRLSNGVNAVAHSCYDRRTPGKKDDVSFVVTKLDEERSIAVGIITRIIRQNL